MSKEIIFLIIILFANIVQGITGFAGTILAMPLSIYLVDLTVAKAVLNTVGILSSIYVCTKEREKIQFILLRRILVFMVIGMFFGFYFMRLLQGYESVQYKLLGSFIIVIGCYNMFFKKKENVVVKTATTFWMDGILFLAGIAHGMFVSGGPLLVVYLTQKIKDKSEFRATISFVWIILNTMMFFQQIQLRYFTQYTIILTIASVFAVVCSMVIGNILHKKMSQQLFMSVTNILLIISGMSLLLK